MDSVSVAQQYFDAWNRRDPGAIVATFLSGGTYSDPISGEISGQAIGDYAAGLFAAFPDLSFELAGLGNMQDGALVARWVMHGTNTGPFMGLPPTGRTISSPGVDFIVVEDDRIRSVRGYFDSRAVPEQLGLQVIVQPKTLGPLVFGSSTTMHGAKSKRPGAISLTSLQVRSPQESDEVRNRARQIFGEVARMPGFISMLTAGIAGQRHYTATAWESVEQVKQIHGSEAHREAVNRFYGSDFASGAMFSVWVPDGPVSLWVRCDACKKVALYENSDGRCACGAELPEPPPYW